MRLVPFYEGDRNIGSVPLTTNLDTWDGLRWRHQALGCHLGMGRLDDGRYYTCYSSDWPEGIVRRKKDDGTYEILFRCEDDFGSPATNRRPPFVMRDAHPVGWRVGAE